MRINKTKEDCCGCSACESVCPYNAISMRPDDLGFLYPRIDEAICVDCGLCEKVCAFHDNYDKSQNVSVPVSYAAKHKDPMEIEASQSGAAFVSFSDYILEQDGVVYGVGYTDHFRVVHKRALNKEERDEFRGSKYVQSDMNTVFRQVKEDLKNGLIVLFSGTPCQTAGLSAFVGKRLRSNLFLLDIVCHGVPAPLVWYDYLKFLEIKERRRITAVNFRDKKRFGWRSHVESFVFDNTYTYTYNYTFYTNIVHRRSCGECPYTNIHRPSDVTVADFWGIEKTIAAPLGADNKGCSLILVNTDKGRDWFDQIKEKMEFMPVSLENCLQPQLRYPSILHPKRIEFERDYGKNGFIKTMRIYGLMGWKSTMKHYKETFTSLLPRSVKQSIKRIIQRH